MEDLELWSEYGSPSTTEAKLAWKVKKFKVTWVLKEENVNYNNNYMNNQSIDYKLPPFNFAKFRNILRNSQLTYPTSKNVVVDKWQFENYLSDYFYATTDGILYFNLKKDYFESNKKRLELREQKDGKNIWWRKDTDDIHYLNMSVKLQPLSWNIIEYTFAQIQEKEYYKPLLRLVVRKEKNWKINHVWAVIRNTIWYNSQISDRIDLGPVSNNFEKFDIYIWNNSLKLYRNKKILINRDISYWTPKQNYFKVGIYDSVNSKWPFNIKIWFRQLDWWVKNENVYQLKSSKIDYYDPNYYYTVSWYYSNLDYDKLIPKSYRNKIDSFFDLLISKYSSNELRSKLDILSGRIDDLIEKYKYNNKVLVILYYIKNKIYSLYDTVLTNP